MISEQAILISTSLQSICDEIILKREGRQVKSLTARSHRNAAAQIPFLTRDKSLLNGPVTNSNDAEKHHKPTSNELEENKLFEDITNDDL